MKHTDSRKKYTISTTNSFTDKPAAPIISRHLIQDKKNIDPSACVTSERYPIPSFFEYRMKPRDYDYL